MVAMAQLIPEDPQEQASVLEVLRQHPELKTFIAKASAKAEQIFPGATMHLDTVQYDDWDPPVRLIIGAPMEQGAFMAVLEDFLGWLRNQSNYNRELILVFPKRIGRTEGFAHART
ncbi:MAG: hypothetical protein ACR2OU_15675 [Thermomicrobiales bacterium]